MRFAVISDIHGNIVALDSVLNDIISRNLDAVICTGDMVGYLPYPKEVINRIREKNILVIKGNHDKAIAEQGTLSDEAFAQLTEEEVQRSASGAFMRNRLDEEDMAYLNRLPESAVLEFDGFTIRFVHGSPKDITEYMYEDEAGLAELADSFGEDAVVSGHTHIPYHKVVGEKHFINAGSVGKPKHGNPKSTYVIIDICDGSIDVEIAEVAYDVAAMTNVIKENTYFPDKLIGMLEEGR